jgi:peptidoglycan/xylan/chitin deacetylase (PgdA/CDA1 family)
MKKIIAFILVMMVTSLCADNNAVILLYHRVGDARYPTTNVTIKQFSEEMQYLNEQHYKVLPLPEIIAKLKSGEALPDKTVGITFDDAYDTVYTNAWPILKKQSYPFTLFVATQPIDKSFKGMMSWTQIKELAKQGVTIGDHSVTHAHLANATIDTLKEEIMTAKQHIYQETGQLPTLFAYPFGEYSLQFRDELVNLGFVAAVTQITGAVSARSDFYLLPRIPLNEHYAELGRFKQLLTIQPLMIKTLEPRDPVLKQNPPVISFTITDPTINMKSINCYDASGVSLEMNKPRSCS